MSGGSRSHANLLTPKKDTPQLIAMGEMYDVTPGSPISAPLIVPVIAQSTTPVLSALTISENGMTIGTAPKADIISD